MRSLFTILLLFPLLAHAGGELQVSDAWLRAMPPGQPNSAAYMTLKNEGTEAVAVVAVSSELAERAEFHESSQRDGMWRMQALPVVTLAADEIIVLAPGGKHLMLFGLKRSPREGERVAFQLSLQDGRQVAVTAVVRGPGSAGMSHAHH